MQAVIAVNAIDTQRVDVVRYFLLSAYLGYVLIVHRITSFTDG